MEVRVVIPCGEETLYFAAQELGRYLAKMVPGGQYAVLCATTPEQKASVGIHLGVGGDLRIPQVEDCRLDDGYYIEVSGGQGVILGTNARSVLLAVYRDLTQLGAALLRPGSGGGNPPCYRPGRHSGKAGGQGLLPPPGCLH